MSRFTFILPLVLLGALVACSESDPATPEKDSEESSGYSQDGASHHGAIVGLGTVTLGGESFTIARHGACELGKESAFVVSRIGDGKQTGLFLWVEDASGKQICAPAQGDRSGEDWHFHVTPRADAAEPTRAILRLREGELDERAGVAVENSAAPVHDGVAAPIISDAGAVAAWVELKLHDDKGDLELWLAEDGQMTRPLDLPLDGVVTVTFLDHEARKVELRVRNMDQNEDEDGKGNIRSGGTNYFIFPGESGADASWLEGTGFRSAVSLSIPMPDGHLSSPIFVLVPHGHGPEGHEHWS